MSPSVATTSATTNAQVRSIQGEQIDTAERAAWATSKEVEDYVAKASEDVIECRERGRHTFPSVRKSMTFSRLDPTTGLLVREVGCVACADQQGNFRVVRVELWDVRHHKGEVTLCELASASTVYRGSDYLATPGSGRMKPKQIRNALGTEALKGAKIVTIRKAAVAASKAAEQGEREAS